MAMHNWVEFTKDAAEINPRCVAKELAVRLSSRRSLNGIHKYQIVHCCEIDYCSLKHNIVDVVVMLSNCPVGKPHTQFAAVSAAVKPATIKYF